MRPSISGLLHEYGTLAEGLAKRSPSSMLCNTTSSLIVRGAESAVHCGEAAQRGLAPAPRSAHSGASVQREIVEQVCILFAWGGQHDGVGRVGLGTPVEFFPLFTPEFSQQKKKFSAEITMPTLPNG